MTKVIYIRNALLDLNLIGHFLCVSRGFEWFNVGCYFDDVKIALGVSQNIVIAYSSQVICI